MGCIVCLSVSLSTPSPRSSTRCIFTHLLRVTLSTPKKVSSEVVNELCMFLYKWPILFISSYHILVSLFSLLYLYLLPFISYKNGNLSLLVHLYRNPSFDWPIFFHEFLAILERLTYFSWFSIHMMRTFLGGFMLPYPFIATNVFINLVLKGWSFLFSRYDVRLLFLLILRNLISPSSSSYLRTFLFLIFIMFFLWWLSMTFLRWKTSWYGLAIPMVEVLTINKDESICHLNNVTSLSIHHHLHNYTITACKGHFLCTIHNNKTIDFASRIYRIIVFWSVTLALSSLH